MTEAKSAPSAPSDDPEPQSLIASPGIFHAFRLKPGENLTQGLRRAFDLAQTEAMAVVSCVGSLTQVAIRHANQPGATLYQGHFEITSLVGTLDRAGEHLHLTITDGEGRAFGGHLLPEQSAIYTTAEIVTIALPKMRFQRLPCPQSGYDELVVTSQEGETTPWNHLDQPAFSC